MNLKTENYDRKSVFWNGINFFYGKATIRNLETFELWTIKSKENIFWSSMDRDPVDFHTLHILHLTMAHVLPNLQNMSYFMLLGIL